MCLVILPELLVQRIKIQWLHKVRNGGLPIYQQASIIQKLSYN
ncbi:Uncharacterised protein [Legionella birminghamensis]|uniref:Uncharacterized protein n=1 Tax=Legionella birminghamensis TaxID=28083 RepID=A0A378I768_9GAMM|nr:Uncharacterised protein [Legionella birminghamensis]